MAKVRGQNHPAISLAEAISKIKVIYEQERDRAVDETTIAKALGDCVSHTAFTSTISALIKYGLLESIEPSLFKVSEDAENIILLSKGHPDRIRALKNIAFTPYLFSKIRERLSEGLPNNDTIRASLVEMGFGPRTLENVVYSYRNRATRTTRASRSIGVLREESVYGSDWSLAELMNEFSGRVSGWG